MSVSLCICICVCVLQGTHAQLLHCIWTYQYEGGFTALILGEGGRENKKVGERVTERDRDSDRDTQRDLHLLAPNSHLI